MSSDNVDRSGVPDDERHHAQDGVEFVMASISVAQRDKQLSPGGRVTAEGICRVLLELAVDNFGAEGKDVLLEWGLATSEDVGLVTDRLSAAGYELKRAAEPWPEAFANLFDLKRPPEQWKLRWT